MHAQERQTCPNNTSVHSTTTRIPCADGVTVQQVCFFLRLGDIPAARGTPPQKPSPRAPPPPPQPPIVQASPSHPTPNTCLYGHHSPVAPALLPDVVMQWYHASQSFRVKRVQFMSDSCPTHVHWWVCLAASARQRLGRMDACPCIIRSTTARLPEDRSQAPPCTAYEVSGGIGSGDMRASAGFRYISFHTCKGQGQCFVGDNRWAQLSPTAHNSPPTAYSYPQTPHSYPPPLCSSPPTPPPSPTHISYVNRSSSPRLPQEKVTSPAATAYSPASPSGYSGPSSAFTYVAGAVLRRLYLPVSADICR